MSKPAPFWLVPLIAAIGCSDPIVVGPSAPHIDAPTVAQAAVSQLDANGDQMLSEQELAQAPGLLHGLPRLDTDANGSVSADEIAARINSWQIAASGTQPFICSVWLDGLPLEGAIVTLDPEPFLGDQYQPVSAPTGADGVVSPVAASESPSTGAAGPAGVYCGFYRIRITHPGMAIAPRFNTTTTLGTEVAPDAFDRAMPSYTVSKQ